MSWRWSRRPAATVSNRSGSVVTGHSDDDFASGVFLDNVLDRLSDLT
jgi:hypothetical protein